MKKISVMLLAAMMLFVFAACDDSTPEVPAMTQEALVEAINSANEGDTVTLTGNVTATKAIEINNAITLDGAGDMRPYRVTLYGGETIKGNTLSNCLQRR